MHGIPKPTKKQELAGSKKPDVKNEEKKWKKPVGIKISNDASIPTPSVSKLKIHEQKTSMTKKISDIKAARSAPQPEKNKSLKEEFKLQEEKVKVSWATKPETVKEATVHKRQLIIRPERDDKQEAEDFEKELKETERQAEEEAKRLMKPRVQDLKWNQRGLKKMKCV